MPRDTRPLDYCRRPGCMGVATRGGCCEQHREYAYESGEEVVEKRTIYPYTTIDVTKPTNPKDAIGTEKLPMHLIPGPAKAAMALAFLEGALKYGKYNWRVAGVRTSIYLDAMERHLEKYKNGENCDPVTGVPHLASIMACCAIIIDASVHEKLNDDRPPSGPTSDYIDSLAQNVRHLQGVFAGENPHQYTIEDTCYGLETEQS